MKKFKLPLKLLAAIAFSYSLSVIVSQLTLSPFALGDVAFLIIMSLFWIGLFELVDHFPKHTLIVLLVLLVFGFIFRDAVIDWLYSDLANEIGSSVRWALMLPEFKFEMPEIYMIVYVAVLSLFSVFIIWFNPLKLLASVVLVLPLFFIDDLTTFNWFVPLIIGLGAVLFFFNDHDYLLPNTPLLLTILVVVGVLGAVVQPRTFFYRPLNHYINRDQLGNSFGQFNLRQVGYDTGSTQIGGPVTINDDPFMVVSGPPMSFYLRGNAFSEFEDETWLAQSNKERFLFNNQLPSRRQREAFYINLSVPEDMVVDELNYLAMDNYFESYVEPVVAPVRSLFVSGKPFSIIVSDDVDVFFDLDGMITSEPTNSAPYRMISTIEPVSNNTFSNLILTDSTYRLPRVEAGYEFRDSGTLSADDELFTLVYEQFDNNPSIENLALIVDHFKSTYDYELEVESPRNYRINNPSFSNTLRTFFEDKEGYCVYFGSALALLLQDVGVKARYVEGFVVESSQSDDITSIDQRVVRNNHAHAWTEVLIPQLGWVIVDATPSAHISDLVEPAPEVSNPDDFEEPDLPDEPEIDEPEIDEPEEVIEPEVEEPIVEDPESPEEESSFINSLLIVAVILGLIIFIQQRRFNNRHDPDYLAKRFSENEKQTIIEIYKDLQKIYGLNHQYRLNTNSVSQSIYQITKAHNILDNKQMRFAILAINDALYSDKPSHPLSINALTQLYFRVEKASSVQSNSVKYFLYRVLFNI